MLCSHYAGRFYRECDQSQRGTTGRQPGNLTLLRPPTSFCKWGEWNEKGGTANNGNLKRFPFSSPGSHSPEIFQCLSPPPLCTYITVPSAAHWTLFHWLIDWSVDSITATVLCPARWHSGTQSHLNFTALLIKYSHPSAYVRRLLCSMENYYH